MSVIDLVNIFSSIVSLVLSVVAIWLSLHFYDKSKNSEKLTEVNVNEIKIQTKLLTDVSSRMLDKYTDYSTKPKEADETFKAVIQLLSQTTFASIGTYPTNNNVDGLRSFAASTTILAFFYAGFCNLVLQDLLPESTNLIDPDSNLPSILNASKEDFTSLESILSDIDVSDNSLVNIYQFALSWKAGGLIKDMAELYPESAS